eukprot:TRINITY_DN19845_c0_g1_i2.p1 TRINITY_DN19845_c0_g1~~TRINITY_DN19845_c0_g1_i2.p1  ORF type:complete len:361 (-),score=94.47 TRINITY_DN19845_c0_g1_i2:112-1194(-)
MDSSNGSSSVYDELHIEEMESPPQSDDEQEESIESLLSGPKDSVTMFQDTLRRPKFNLDMAAGADPLDQLVQQAMAQYQASKPPTSERTILAKTASCSSSSMGSSGRDSIHQKLDSLLDEALRSQLRTKPCSPSSSSTSCHHAEEQADKESEILRLREQLREREHEVKEQGDKDSEILRLREQLREREKEVKELSKKAEMHEQSQQEALHVQLELEADVVSANLQVFDLKRQLDLDQEVVASVRALQDKLEAREREIEKEFLELRLLRGERDALQQCSAADLARLTALLGESLMRVQRESLRKFEKLADEQLCVICLSLPKNVVLQPCNHLAMCETCFSKCNTMCPQCRSGIERHFVVYA